LARAARRRYKKRMIALPIARLAGAALFFALPSAADAGASDWARGAKSAARLVSAGGPARDGALRAGLEIRLQPGAITYWRHPGDAGAPPVFDFSASENLAGAEPVYPAPKRIPEAGAEAFGYDRDVIFPLRVRASDPGKPVRLKLKLDYAACEKLCIPEQATLELTLTPGAAPAGEAGAIANFEALAPTAWAGAPPRATRVAGAAKPTWVVAPPFAPAPGGDLFAEGPEGAFLDARRRADGGFDLVLDQKAPDMGDVFEARLTRTAPEGAHEIMLRLDAGAAKP
jgi:DsbC/DsbD-like thiol-disulfide interchange protein